MKPNDRQSKGMKSVSSINAHLLSRSSPADDPRREVYGWSVSTRASAQSAESVNNIPVPIHCRPIFNTQDETQVKITLNLKIFLPFIDVFFLAKIWCAVGIDLTGSTSTTDSTSVDQLNKQLIESYHQMIDEQCLKLSSFVWIAAKLNNTAMITILDSNQSEKILETFPLGNAIIYAMGSVPGLKEERI